MVNHNNIHLVSTQILHEIERMHDSFDKEHGDVCISCMKHQKRIMRESANKHSVEMELNEPNKTRLKRIADENLQMLRLAHGQALATYKGSFSDTFLNEIAILIAPEANSAGMRTSSTRVIYPSEEGHQVYSQYPRPGEYKIGRELEVFRAENKHLENPVEKAFHAHFHIARVHPYVDGNGRLARVIQNAVLEKNHYHPLLIKTDERGIYMDLLEKALVSYDLAEQRIEKDKIDKYRLKLQKSYEAKYRGGIPLNNEEKEYIREKSQEMLRRKITSEQTQFYDFLALRLRDSLRDELNRAERAKQKNHKH